MDGSRFDRISKAFADRRLSRRQALAQGGVALAAGALTAAGTGAGAARTQEATPSPQAPLEGSQKTPYLFVQSFQSGSVTPKEGGEGRFTVQLEQGLGQTLYFADRPSRDVGALPTPDFLAGLGFPEDNPANAALVVDNGAGGTNIAVLELFNPLYDPVSPGVTYEVEVLKDWQSSTELGFTEAPVDLSALASSFGPAHLFIDDCASGFVYCERCSEFSSECGTAFPFTGMATDFCFIPPNGACLPCVGIGSAGPAHEEDVRRFWSQICNEVIAPDWCNGGCTVSWGPWKGE